MTWQLFTLPPAYASSARYLITVVTAQLRGSGTESQVYLDLVGDNGTSGKTILRNGSPKCFAAGQVGCRLSWGGIKGAARSIGQGK